MKKTTECYAPSKGLAMYELSRDSITTRGENPYVQSAQNQYVELSINAHDAANEIILQTQNISQTIPKYYILFSTRGAGDRLRPVILAGIGAFRRFHSGKSLNSYVDNDAQPYQSGSFESRNCHISKRGRPALWKSYFEVMKCLKLKKTLTSRSTSLC